MVKTFRPKVIDLDTLYLAKMARGLRGPVSPDICTPDILHWLKISGLNNLERTRASQNSCRLKKLFLNSPYFKSYAVIFIPFNYSPDRTLKSNHLF